METPSSDPSPAELRPINRVTLACIQCRSRHVRCDATQPVCNRCRRDGKECTYQKSRRGGLDKAALARRRLMLQQQAERIQQTDEGVSHQSSNDSSNRGEQEDCLIIPNFDALNILRSAEPNTISFHVNVDRLVDLYYENFYPSFPITLPLHYLNQRKLNDSHGMDLLLLVMQFVGSIYAPWTPSDPYYEKAYKALCMPDIPKTGFTVQALTILAVAQHSCDFKLEARKMLDLAISIGLELQINSRDFAYLHGEGNPVLEESWRRAYYFLHITDQHFAVAVTRPQFFMMNVPNHVNLPCDDEYYELGQIPPTVTWQEYENREFAEIEVVYSSIVYLYDIGTILTYIMRRFLEMGTFTDTLISAVDAKVAIWQSLLPACKKDPLRADGKVDEIIYLAHLVIAIIIMNCHRPFSSLAYSVEEFSTKSFVPTVPFVDPLRQGQAAHTARALKGAEIYTKTLAIPCKIETHHLFTLCIAASMTTAQISACTILLEDHALSIARDRIRLSIGYLSQMGSLWPLAKKMAQDVRFVARRTLSGVSLSTAPEPDSVAEIEIPRDEMIWSVNPCTQIDIYSGLVLPINGDTTGYQSSSASSIIS